jgi:hypothetical protein
MNHDRHQESADSNCRREVPMLLYTDSTLTMQNITSGYRLRTSTARREIKYHVTVRGYYDRKIYYYNEEHRILCLWPQI